MSTLSSEAPAAEVIRLRRDLAAGRADVALKIRSLLPAARSLAEMTGDAELIARVDAVETHLAQALSGHPEDLADGDWTRNFKSLRAALLDMKGRVQAIEVFFSQ